MRVAIVGGGFSGGCLAAHLLRENVAVRIVLIEKRLPVGHGAAYGTREPEHLLNVSCAKMGLWADKPDDFHRWLQETGRPVPSHAFVPRALYGEYVSATIARAEAGAPGVLRRVNGEALGLEKTAGGWRVRLEKESVEADAVVLATGVGEPHDPAGLRQAGLPVGAYLHDPWAPGALASFEIRGDAVLLGTGLTMVDVTLFLAARHPHLRIEAVSPHGSLPEAHLPVPEAPVPADGFDPRRPLRALLRDYRRRQAEAEARGVTWRAAFDGLRPHHVAIWRALSAADRRRFLRHLRHRWNVSRHRMPASSAEVVHRLRKEGRLRLHAGKVERVEAGNGILSVDIRRAAGERETVRASHVINCCGQDAGCDQAASPFLRGLLDAGWVAQDPLHLGLETDAAGALLGRSGMPSPGLYAVGAMRRAAEWEATAVPELRVQAFELARLLAASSG